VNSLVIAGIVFACTFGGAMVGLLLRALLPEHHLSNESKEIVKLGTGLIATMSALVIGLLVASAKSDFDAQRSAFQQMAANIALLDRGLALYGPEAKDARALLRRNASTLLDRIWTPQGTSATGIGDPEILETGALFYDSLRNLSPHNESQRSIQTQALQIAADLARTRFQLIQREQTSIPVPFLVVLVTWLTILFMSFGLFSPSNATVILVLFVCALSVAGALLLIVDLDQPFEGLIQISPDPLRNAVSRLGQ
jgi:hypothetical protein